MTWTRKATVYRTQVTMRPLPSGAFMLWTIPHPIHSATVTATGRNWQVLALSLGDWVPVRYYTQAEALRAARDLISLRAGQDLMTFDGTQRTAMGQQRCPKYTDGLLCAATAQGISVWCERHPYGRERNYA